MAFRNTFPRLLERQAANMYVEFIDEYIAKFEPRIIKLFEDQINEIVVDQKDLDDVLDDIVSADNLPNNKINARTKRLTNQLDTWNKNVVGNNIRLVDKIEKIKSIPIDQASPLLRKHLTNYSTTNSELIKQVIRESGRKVSAKIKSKIQNDIADITSGAITKGQSLRTVSKTIRETTDVVKKKAKFWARDQLGKTYGKLTETRQLDAGFPGYDWLDSGDRRVRETHSNKNGEFFRWDSPPADTGHPGEDFQCRCDAIPSYGTKPILTKRQIQSANKFKREDDIRFKSLKRASKQRTKRRNILDKPKQTKSDLKRITTLEKKETKFRSQAEKAKTEIPTGKKRIPKFINATTTIEAEQAAVKMGITTNANYKNIKVSSANVVNRTVVDIFNKYPELTALSFLGKNPKRQRAFARANARGVRIQSKFFNQNQQAFTAEFERETILHKRNRKNQRDKLVQRFKESPQKTFLKDMIKDLDDTTAPRWLTFNSDRAADMMRSVISHEMGHVLHDQFAGGINKVFRSGAVFNSIEADIWNGIINDIWFFSRTKGSGFSFKKISEYSWKKPTEFFAESFAMFEDTVQRKNLPPYVFNMLSDFLSGKKILNAFKYRSDNGVQ